MISIIRLCVCLIWVTITHGFIINLSKPNVNTIKTATKIEVKPKLGCLSSFEVTIVHNQDGSRSKTSKKTYKKINEGIAIYTTITENLCISCPNALEH